jgi:gamma-glutamyltranspeptidase/glutathione hydrolase
VSPSRYQINPGPKTPALGKDCVASSDNIIVTEAMIRILELGGGAVDAAIAGCLVQAVVEPYMTNHTGTVTMLCWNAKDGDCHQLDSCGTLPAGMAPFKPVPPIGSGYGFFPPSACMPGFMPGLKAMHERFGTLPWSQLCEDAVRWAESGHEVTSFEYGVNLWGEEFTTYTVSGRAFYKPTGRFDMVGETFRSPELAETMRQVSAHGPDYMIEGPWADRFVALANRIGWKISKAQMTETPPRWIEPVRAKIGGYEIVGLAPPQRQGLHSIMVLGILEALNVGQWAPQSAERYLLMAHTLRWVERDLGYVNDPEHFNVPVETMLDPAYHAHIARLIGGSLPKVDLTQHVKLTSPDMAPKGAVPMVHAGIASASHAQTQQSQPAGSCELSVVDRDGNWVQMMNTLQSGGIPGHVIDGVPMVGTHATFGWPGAPLDAKLTPGYRMRTIMGNTMVLKDGQPVLALGTPGRPNGVAQVLANFIFHGLSPVESVDEPRILPLSEDGVLIIEDRVLPETLTRLNALGLPARVTPAWDWHMGSFQVCWRDTPDGPLNAYADPRRCGVAAGLDAAD